MKRKSIYSLVLICFLGLLSSANQSNKDCKDEAYFLAAKSNCTCPKASKAEANTMPLNLFLFDL